MNLIRPRVVSMPRTLALVMSSSLFLAAAGCGGDEPKTAAEPPPLPVTVVEVESQGIPDRRRFPGTTQAVMEVSLEARIEGFLEERLFVEGSVVDRGEILFVIEQPPYEADVLQAAGQLAEAQADFELARLDYERNLPLAETGAVSSQDLDQYEANLASARGKVEAAEAALIQAEIKLEYTEVRAPFKGRIGERLVDLGNVVGGVGNPTKLATLIQVDPMRVIFQPSGSDVAAFLAAWPSTEVSVEITVPGENDGKPIKGRLDLVDNVADNSTSTFLARAEFSNVDGKVIPGLVTDLVVDLGIMPDQLVVPDEAIRNDPQHAYVWVEKDGTISRTDVDLGPQWKGLRVVKGLKGGDRVLVTGNPMALRTGLKVKANTVTIEDFLSKSAKPADSKSTDPHTSHPSHSPAAKASLHDSGVKRPKSSGGGS